MVVGLLKCYSYIAEVLQTDPLMNRVVEELSLLISFPSFKLIFIQAMSIFLTGIQWTCALYSGREY